MHKVFDNLYLNLDQHLDVPGLMELKPRISAFIANNGQYLRPVKYRHGSVLDHTLFGIPDFQHKFELEPEKYPHADLIRDCISKDTFGTYIAFEEDNVIEGSYSLNLRYPTDFKKKHLAAYCQLIAADQQFDFFYQWLEQQQIFSDYGRVNFFVTPKGSKTEIHRDYLNSTTDRSLLTAEQLVHITDSAESEQFILINFSNRKKLFLYNDVDNQKIAVDGTCVWFDASNYHGTEPVTQSAYSLRIDGVFTDSFLNKIKN